MAAWQPGSLAVGLWRSERVGVRWAVVYGRWAGDPVDNKVASMPEGLADASNT